MDGTARWSIAAIVNRLHPARLLYLFRDQYKKPAMGESDDVAIGVLREQVYAKAMLNSG